jgi:glycerol-3-phosphate dehydrogenase (NAD(P)+)
MACEYLVIAIPAQEIRAWLKENFIFNGQKILVASKGIEASSGKFLNEIYADFVPENNIGFISGPSFAAEVIQGLPCALVINSSSKNLYDKFSSFFPDFIKAYYSEDVIGAEVAGAYKNVLAIASGICEGLYLGKNAQASLIARGLVEMERFGNYFGAKTSSFLGLSGAGDLFLTANSTMSRNYRVGLGLALNKDLNEILKDLGEVAEGIKTADAIYKLSLEHGIYTPIANEVKLILDGKNPKDSLRDLLKH